MSGKITPQGNVLTVAMAQIAPVWLNKEKTLEKVASCVEDAAGKDADLIVFGEALVPGYPYWLERTNATEFNSPMQKELFAHYARNSIQIEQGDLNTLCKLAKTHQMGIYLGSIERAADRGGHSLYCSLVFIDNSGKIRSVHRKLQPTYDERLVWSPGDGNGLRVHPLKDFTVGGLNCWENWMPLPRSALYGMGEDLHIAVWPGSDHNTRDITRFIARESRSFVVSVSCLMSKDRVTGDIPFYDEIVQDTTDIWANGGSCVSGPDGEWIIEPNTTTDGLILATLDHGRVLEERQNFDPVGHYSRPDVTSLTINRKRQSILEIEDENDHDQ